MTEYQKDFLHQHIESVNDINDLIPILQCIPFNEIRHFVQQKVDKLSSDEIRTVYHKHISIEEIFPDDLIQYILSFNGLYHARSVNKKWKQMCEKNEELEIINTHKSITTLQPNQCKYDETLNKTWVVDKFRKRLHSKEIALGYIGPTTDIQTTINECQPGDRLLIHNGTYIYSGYGPLEINKSLQLIGIGTGVRIKMWDEFVDLEVTCEGKQGMNIDVYFQNITFDNVYGGCTTIYVEHYCRLWMNNVKIKFSDYGMVIHDTVSAYIERCDFIGLEGAQSAICIYPSAKDVHINRCSFRNCFRSNVHDRLVVQPCICLNFDEDDWSLLDQVIGMKFIGNIFEDNMGYPIGLYTPERHDEGELMISINKENRYELRENVLKGYNGITMEKQPNDANTLYYVYDN